MKKVDYKWVMLALVSAAYFLAQGSRQIYAAVLPDIKAALGGNVSDTSLGLVGSAFTWAFGIMMPFAGLAADFFRRKWILVIGSLLFSIGILLSGFASGIGLLLIAYGIMNGVGQSLMPPCNSSLIGQFHDDRLRHEMIAHCISSVCSMGEASVCRGFLVLSMYNGFSLF